MVGLKEDNTKLQKKWDDLNFEHSRLMHRVGEIEEYAQSQAQRLDDMKSQLALASGKELSYTRDVARLEVRLVEKQKESDTRYTSVQRLQKQEEGLILQNGLLINVGIGQTRVIADLAATLKELSKK
ncbi:MAG: hypothetical protein ACI9SY_000004 [Candidatus Paceibacteria bacterium]|jgi:hypothetical protein